MPNHVRAIAVPRDEDVLACMFRHVNRQYTGYISARLRVTCPRWGLGQPFSYISAACYGRGRSLQCEPRAGAHRNPCSRMGFIN